MLNRKKGVTRCIWSGLYQFSPQLWSEQMKPLCAAMSTKASTQFLLFSNINSLKVIFSCFCEIILPQRIVWNNVLLWSSPSVHHDWFNKAATGQNKVRWENQIKDTEKKESVESLSRLSSCRDGGAVPDHALSTPNSSSQSCLIPDSTPCSLFLPSWRPSRGALLFHCPVYKIWIY